jgi:hypothetical protein
MYILTKVQSDQERFPDMTNLVQKSENFETTNFFSESSEY